MTDNVIRTMAEEHMRIYKQMLVENHQKKEEYLMCAMQVYSDVKQQVSVIVFANGRPEQEAVLAIRIALERFKADAVIYQSDTWYREVEDMPGINPQAAYERYAYHGRVHADPKKMEGLLVAYETRK